MHTRNLSQLIVLSVLFATMSACATTSAPSRPAGGLATDSAAVVAVIDGFLKALAQPPGQGALAFMTDDAFVLEGGIVESKDQYRSGHLTQDATFAKAIAAGRRPMKVVVDGNTAWSVSSTAAQGEIAGRSVDSEGAELIVLSKVGANWKIRAIHWSSRARR